MTNIDKNSPIVIATAGTGTITEGDSHEVSSYFTYEANGIAGITSVTYTVNGSAISNTNILEAGTYTIVCTVTKETGAVASAAKTIIVESSVITSTEIASNPSEYYGGVVTNYTCTNSAAVDAWKIFYADNSNIYLIADDYIAYNYAPNGRGGSTIYKNSADYRLSFNNVISDYSGSASILDTSIMDSRVKKWISYVSDNKTSTNNNIKAVAYMLDTNIWSVYKNSAYADYAIGGPTLDMFVTSYNQKYPSLNIGYAHNSTGYTVGTGGTNSSYAIGGLNTSDSTYVINDSSKNYAMWLAAPSAQNTSGVMVVFSELLSTCNYNYNYAGFRPLVCLKSDVELEQQKDGTYIIK